MRKGSTEMWWIIIGAVIALIVVIILLVMFTGKTRDLEIGATECGGKGGICAVKNIKDANVESCPANTLEISTFSCSATEVCCIGIPKKCTAADDPTTCGKDKAGKVISCKPFGKNYYCP